MKELKNADVERKSSSSRNEAEPVISEDVKASSSTVKPSPKKDDESGADSDSKETKVEDPKFMKEHKDLMALFYIPRSVTDTIAYSQSRDKIGLLNLIGKELYQKGYKDDFKKYVTTGETTTSGRQMSLKKAAQLQEALDQARQLKRKKGWKPLEIKET